MSIFNYTLPSGSTFRLSAPSGTTQLQADLIFYGQVAAGALVGYSPGQTLTSVAANITKFGLSRLDRGTAGVDTQAILALTGSGLGASTTNTGLDVLTNNSLGALTSNGPGFTNNGLGILTNSILDTLTNNVLNDILTLNNLPTSTGIPALVNTPLTNPINQANLININTGLPVTAIGPLSSIQVQGILAQVANLVDQPADTMSDDKGVGLYGLSCVQLEQAGYVKPNTWKRFIFDPAPLTSVLSSPGVWTGKGGVTTAAQFLSNPGTQTRAMTSLLQDGYTGLVSNGVITPSTTQAVTASVGQVFAQNNVTSALKNTAVGDVGALVANAGRFGSAAAAAWSQSSNLTSLVNGQIPNPANVLSGLSGSLSTTVGNIGQSVSSLTSNLDITGKAAQFATAFSNPTSAVTKLANTDVGALATGALNGATTAATNAITNATAATTSAVNNAIDSVNGQISNVTDKLSSLSNLSLDSLSNIFGGGAGDLVAKVQTAAGFTNTTNRGTLDVAFVKILGSSKIPVPSFEAPSANSLSLSSATDILSATTILQNLKSQGGALLGQGTQAQTTVTGLVTQAQNTASGLSGQAGGIISNALNQAGRRIG